MLKVGDLIRITKGEVDTQIVVKAVMPGLGCVMAIDGASCAPGTAMGKRFQQAEAAVRDEERATMMASLGVKPQ